MTMLQFQMAMMALAALFLGVVALASAELRPATRLGRAGGVLAARGKALWRRGALSNRGSASAVAAPAIAKADIEAACQARLTRIMRQAGGLGSSALADDLSGQAIIDRLDEAFARFERGDIGIAHFRSLAADELEGAASRRQQLLESAQAGEDDGSGALEDLDHLLEQLTWCLQRAEAIERAEVLAEAA